MKKNIKKFVPGLKNKAGRRSHNKPQKEGQNFYKKTGEMDLRPKLPTPPTTSDEEENQDDYEDADVPFTITYHDTDLQCGIDPFTKLRVTDSLVVENHPLMQETEITDNTFPVKRKPLPLPPTAIKQNSLSQDNQTKHKLPLPKIPLKPNWTGHSNKSLSPLKKINVVKPNIKSPHPKIERGLHKEIIYVHGQRQMGLSLFEISSLDKTKPPVPQKPGRRILIKEPPPLPRKSDEGNHSVDENDNGPEFVKKLSVNELAEELAKLKVEENVVENIKQLRIDGAFITKMNQSLISNSLKANELDTLKIYQYVYHGWKPLM